MKTINLEIQVPDWAEYIAMDEAGNWTAFSGKPEAQDRKDNGWWRQLEGHEVTIAEVHHNARIDWQQSLRKV